MRTCGRYAGAKADASHRHRQHIAGAAREHEADAWLRFVEIMNDVLRRLRQPHHMGLLVLGAGPVALWLPRQGPPAAADIFTAHVLYFTGSLTGEQNHF